MQTLNPSEISELIKSRIEKVKLTAEARNEGTVTSVSDGIVKIHGLADAMQGEMIELPGNTFALALNLERDSVGAVVLGDYENLREGATAKTTGRILEVPVGPELLGRVLNALGEPIDGKGPLNAALSEPVEKVAPGVIWRKSVSQPVQTGYKSVDAMIPIGRGQRELIIGDRQTGKSAMAVDTIINQKGTGVKCIYVAIGQKASTVANVVRRLTDNGAMGHTIVVAATASESAAMQYISAYSGCTMGEYFRDRGEDALIIYDDLSKQAVAYRQISLLLRRPPGREAYPGDVFYPALPPARARRARVRGLRGEVHQRRRQGQDRLAHRAADHRDAGRRRVRVRADQRDLDHRRPDLPRDRPVQRRHPPGRERRHLGVARRWRGPDLDHEEAVRRHPYRPGAVP
jgi:F-type H+-transporting ATPase subunit alpha